MPIHLRAEPGDYSEGCLLPGDPLRAKYIAETFMEDVRQVNAERGMLGYTGTYRGNRVSVQASGMGCPSAAITIEELVQRGVRSIDARNCGIRLISISDRAILLGPPAAATGGEVTTAGGGR